MSGPARPTRITPAEWGLLLVLAAIQFTHILDFVIVIPLGPEFKTSLSVTSQQFAWMVSAYGFGASASGLLASWFLDRFDRKRSLLVLYIGFTVGTLLCAAAPTFHSSGRGSRRHGRLCRGDGGERARHRRATFSPTRGGDRRWASSCRRSPWHPSLACHWAWSWPTTTVGGLLLPHLASCACRCFFCPRTCCRRCEGI